MVNKWYHLYGVFQSNHFANVYSVNKNDVKGLNLDTTHKISKVKKVEIYVDYGGSIIKGDPLEVRLTNNYSLEIRKESFYPFVNSLTREGFFEKEGDFFVFHTRNPITTFAYVPEDFIEKIKSYNFNQHLDEINLHLDRFNQAMSDVNDYFAKERQENILKKIKEDLKNSKGNKNLN